MDTLTHDCNLCHRGDLEKIPDFTEAGNAYDMGDVETMKKIIISNPQCVNEYVVRSFGFTLLHLAVIYGDLETVKFLVKHGASPNILCSDGKSPLDYARIYATENYSRTFNESHFRIRNYLEFLQNPNYSKWLNPYDPFRFEIEK